MKNRLIWKAEENLKIVLYFQQEVIGFRFYKKVIESYVRRESNEGKILVDEMKEMGKIKNNCKKIENIVVELNYILLILKNKEDIMEN